MNIYVKRVIASHPDSDPRTYSRIRDVEAISRVGHALSQACCVPDAYRDAVAAEALVWRDNLAMALEAIEAAIIDVHANLGMPIPSFEPTRTSTVDLDPDPVAIHSKGPSSPVLSSLVRERTRRVKAAIDDEGR